MTPVPPEAVEAAMKAMGCVATPIGLCASVTHNGARMTTDGVCTFALPVAAAVVAALDLPGREREAAAKALDDAADAEYQRDGATMLVERLLARASALREGRQQP